MWSESGCHRSQWSLQFTVKWFVVYMTAYSLEHRKYFSYIFECVEGKCTLLEAENPCLDLKNTSKYLLLTCTVFVSNLGLILVCHRGNWGGSFMPKHVKGCMGLLSHCINAVMHIENEYSSDPSPLIINDEIDIKKHYTSCKNNRCAEKKILRALRSI